MKARMRATKIKNRFEIGFGIGFTANPSSSFSSLSHSTPRSLFSSTYSTAKHPSLLSLPSLPSLSSLPFQNNFSQSHKTQYNNNNYYNYYFHYYYNGAKKEQRRGVISNVEKLQNNEKVVKFISSSNEKSWKWMEYLGLRKGIYTKKLIPKPALSSLPYSSQMNFINKVKFRTKHGASSSYSVIGGKLRVTYEGGRLLSNRRFYFLLFFFALLLLLFSCVVLMAGVVITKNFTKEEELEEKISLNGTLALTFQILSLLSSLSRYHQTLLLNYFPFHDITTDLVNYHATYYQHLATMYLEKYGDSTDLDDETIIRTQEEEILIKENLLSFNNLLKEYLFLLNTILCTDEAKFQLADSGVELLKFFPFIFSLPGGVPSTHQSSISLIRFSHLSEESEGVKERGYHKSLFSSESFPIALYYTVLYPEANIYDQLDASLSLLRFSSTPEYPSSLFNPIINTYLKELIVIFDDEIQNIIAKTAFNLSNYRIYREDMVANGSLEGFLHCYLHSTDENVRSWLLDCFINLSKDEECRKTLVKKHSFIVLLSSITEGREKAKAQKIIEYMSEDKEVKEKMEKAINTFLSRLAKLN